MKSTYNYYEDESIEDEEIIIKDKESFIIWPSTSGIGIEISKQDIVFGPKMTITPDIKVYPVKDMVRISKPGEKERFWLTKDNIKTILNMEV